MALTSQYNNTGRKTHIANVHNSFHEKKSFERLLEAVNRLSFYGSVLNVI